jgi:hypothetical protein
MIAIIACLPTCIAACCCTKASKYARKNKKLQKRSVRELKAAGSFTKNGIPSSQVLNSETIG